MQEYSYLGWKMNYHAQEATRVIDTNAEIVKIPLLKTEGIVEYEGWWPSPPKEAKSIMITGICLWDARWQIEFAQTAKGNPPARRPLALHIPRQQVIERIKDGKQVNKIYYPSTIGTYHQTLIAWQLKKILQFEPKRILYHLPTQEYHHHIKELELIMNISLESLHLQLDIFSNDLLNYIKNIFDFQVMKKIEFISSNIQESKNAIDSYLYPYQYPEKYNADPNEIFGVEDFAEIKLAYKASQFKRNPIPVLGGIIGLTKPYYMQKELVNTEYMEIKN